ncbi:unnamed protein product, partial [Timema podura]|nr:unnamed protein product [Timema podura]
WENDISYASVPCEYIYDPQNRSILNNSVISQFMIQAAPTCDEMMTEMKWQGEKLNACDHFKQIATEDGICYTFNMMPFHQLLQEDLFV